MHLEKYALTWNAYSDHLRDMMKELMMNDEFTDVTLVSEDKKHIRAHKNILSACSPVFRDIVKLEQNIKPIIYLRGINFFELESIIQFIYLGEATFYEERMNELLAVARSLEIKEFCSAETKDDDDNVVSVKQTIKGECYEEVRKESKRKVDADEPLISNPETFTDYSGEQTIRSSKLMNQEPRNNRDRSEEIRVNGKYECDQCYKTYTGQGPLKRHIQSKHEGVKHDCHLCDFQASWPKDLKRHIESKHEGVKYACDKCEYQATRQDHLKKHIESMHEGVKYCCDQCGFQSSWKSNLRLHIESAHGTK